MLVAPQALKERASSRRFLF